jgi:hypothetical protein
MRTSSPFFNGFLKQPFNKAYHQGRHDTSVKGRRRAATFDGLFYGG